MSRPIIIDTDPGIDDALAIFLAAASPEVEIRGITAVGGNMPIDRVVRNALDIADALGLDCPVGEGASQPLTGSVLAGIADVHGSNGLGGYELPHSSRVAEPAVPLMVRLIEESEEPITIVAIGPLTNLALLLTAHPDTARKVERFVLMGGGTLDVPGNITPAAEFNIQVDPVAAALVFNFGVPITMVGLNVTHKALVGSAHLPTLGTQTGLIAEMVSQLIEKYHDNARGDEDDASAQHDAVAVAAVVDPTMIKTRRRRVYIETQGTVTAGMTVVDHRADQEEGNVDVGFDIDVEGFRKLLDERLSTLGAQLQRDNSAHAEDERNS